MSSRKHSEELPNKEPSAAAPLPRLLATDALLLVDVQNDFCPGGALPIAGGDEIVPVINRWLEAARQNGIQVIASRDWHPPDHCSFRERGGPWPAHCIQHTAGAEFHPGLSLPKRLWVISKGTTPEREEYSGFSDPYLAQELKRQGVRRLWVGGLALDVCVRATVLDALQAGFEVHLIKDATRAVRPGDGRRALAELVQAGCIIESGKEEVPSV